MRKLTYAALGIFTPFLFPNLAFADSVDACLAYDDSHSEMVEICQHALDIGGHSDVIESQLEDYIRVCPL